DVLIVNRERGAGARDLLDRWLTAAGVAPKDVEGYQRELSGHQEVAQAVALGAADVGIAHAGAAAAFGLSFWPLADEVCELVLGEEALTSPPALAMLDVLRSGAFRADLSAFGPYDTARTGDLVV
ncbi:molybdenum-binding protein, partial [mine drainage metagenome]